MPVHLVSACLQRRCHRHDQLRRVFFIAFDRAGFNGLLISILDGNAAKPRLDPLGEVKR
ncbi:Uncharacterised protein [Leclercia adecarboxylata]|uniref:Uncharacterized protein n=1 Tax=Leclercia adecarboxylata TaxID=83655 RepID=A0A4U9HY58_9ENTR|nr:Uncharacterised protein [Leclercia adecarboxylata]